MRQIRIERKPRRDRDDRTPPLPIDPRDPDVVRAKRLAEAAHHAQKSRS
jgi:hypothetical protein